MNVQQCNPREAGAAMIMVIIFGVGMLLLTVLSLDMSKTHATANRSAQENFFARQIAESAAAQAIASIKQGGLAEPRSGGGTAGVWVPFSNGEMLYNTSWDVTNRVSTVRAWGRVAVEPNPATNTVAPDDGQWDGSGWMVHGLELSVLSLKYTPDFPVYFGNGGIERPLGGFEWITGSDPADPTTWGTVTSGVDSFQESFVPFEVSALDHPYDFLYNGGTPTPPGVGFHAYNIWAAQNPIGQFNIDAWFANSAGAGIDATVGLTPSPAGTGYDAGDPASEYHPYPIETGIADVQTFAWELWNTFGSSVASDVLPINQGSHDGDYGDLSVPVVCLCTGKLTVDSGKTFRGSGILIIRDDYDPVLDSNNTPSTKASLHIKGTFEWTGLVIVAGWAPTIEVSSGGNATIVGSLFGEDSVQSGGETSLDSATIILKVKDTFKILYSRGLFEPGGLIYDLMPDVTKEIVGVREL